jgi:shikimate kinase
MPARSRTLKPLALVGFMGAGKTTVGRRVAEATRTRFVDLDEMIESARQESIAQTFASLGEAGFRELEAEMLPRALGEAEVVALGGGAFERLANRRNALTTATVVWLDASFDALWARIRTTAGRPLADAAPREQVEALHAARRSHYAEAHHRVDAAQPLDRVVSEVVRLWSG